MWGKIALSAWCCACLGVGSFYLFDSIRHAGCSYDGGAMRKGLLLLVMLLMPSVCHSQTYTTGSGAIFTFTGTAPSAPCALTRGNQLAINSEAAGSFTQPTFTGSALAGHTHTVTPTGTISMFFDTTA